MEVSIPVGFSSPLQLMGISIYFFMESSVSIPVGFSSPLQLACRRLIFHRVNSFQSLSGFQVRCNPLRMVHIRQWAPGFNPCRVFKSAATLSPLDRKSSMISFNPCRVFKSAATSLAEKLEQLEDDDVSIPVGFSSPLQLGTNVTIDLSWIVSIPVGFSSPLQQSSRDFAYIMDSQFQSLSGFQVRCNVVVPFNELGAIGFQSLSGFQVRCNLNY